MGKTENGYRRYTCRCCGVEVAEALDKWKKKPEKYKNVCPVCLNTRKVKAQTRAEMNRNAGYGPFFGGF